MKYTIDNIPEWLVIEQKIVGCEAVTPLEKFIHDNEPAGTDSAWLWRKSLCAALNEAIENSGLQMECGSCGEVFDIPQEQATGFCETCEKELFQPHPGDNPKI